VLTWLRLIEARNKPLPERGDKYVLTAVALGSAERRQELWLASMRLDCSVKQGSKLTTVQCPRLNTDHSSCASVPHSTRRHHSRPSVMWKYARISRSLRWLARIVNGIGFSVITPPAGATSRSRGRRHCRCCRSVKRRELEAQVGRRTRGRGRETPPASSSLYN
jgi:hypothetical protein